MAAVFAPNRVNNAEGMSAANQIIKRGSEAAGGINGTGTKTQKDEGMGARPDGLLECESQDYVVRIRNTFIERVPLPAKTYRRPASSPPTFAVVEPSNRPSLVPATNEVPEPCDITAEHKPPSSNLPGRLFLNMDPAWPAQNPHAEGLSSQTLHGAIDDIYGYHPSHPIWIGKVSIMLRNVPCRCQMYELENFIKAGGVSPEKWTMCMPPGSNGRNRGYAFITAIHSGVTLELVRVLWQQSIPTRVSQKPLKLQPTA